MSYQKLVRNLRQSSELCDLKPGDQVIMINCPEARKHQGTVWTVESVPFTLCRRLVVILKGYHDCVDVEKLGRVSC
ncbi:hypothetical protein [Faecalispora anaeroviscerum]|uniref:hypothetical protein n=1 Tax=Faecalispora anaeroviscerum TaxID=2991836 RepID=UPI0024B8AD77|nr:hypothetical protein [Faecalispora anaeroviscerum]